MSGKSIRHDVIINLPIGGIARAFAQSIVAGDDANPSAAQFRGCRKSPAYQAAAVVMSGNTYLYIYLSVPFGARTHDFAMMFRC